MMDIDSPYNAFLGRPALAEFRAVIAPWCLTLKFPTDKGVGVVMGDQADLRIVILRKRASRSHGVNDQPQTFKIGDFVYGRVPSMPPHVKPTWEGPCVIEQKFGDDLFLLSIFGGPVLPRAWRSKDLRHCYT